MEEILKQRYAACMFDFDGTLVERGVQIPMEASTIATLQEISEKSYMAICTARPFPGAFKHAAEILGTKYEELQKKWFWFCENGGVGYAYDEAHGEFRPFYRAVWPTNTMSRETFNQLVRDTFTELVSEIDIHESVIILRPELHIGMDPVVIEKKCEMLEQVCIRMLKDNGLEDEIRLGNSSLGIILYGVDADKDRAVQEFGAYLQKHNLVSEKNLSEDLHEIIVFGDRPVGHGNDAFFLNGKFGTPVSVGENMPERSDLISVIDEKNERLIGPVATAHLLKKLQFITR